MMQSVDVLIVEDDEVLSSTMSQWLEKSGYQVHCVRSGLEAVSTIESRNFNVVILDLGLPGIDGLSILEKVREKPKYTPVIIATARDSLSHKLQGLNSGADDYLTKPFDLEELEARIKTILRRQAAENSMRIAVGNLVIDKDLHTASVGKERINLTPTEYKLLVILAEHANAVVEKDLLRTRLGEENQLMMENTLEVNVYRLRKKLAPSGLTLKTIRGIGYSLVEVK